MTLTEEPTGPDGTPETLLVRRLEDQFSGRNLEWLSTEHARLSSLMQSERGIGRNGWLKLQAFRYLITRADLTCKLKARERISCRQKKQLSRMRPSPN